MATTKKTEVMKLREAQNAYVTIAKEIADLSEIKELAKTPELKAKMETIAARYNADYEYLCKQRAYYVGKVLEKSPSLFDKILNDLLKS